MSTRSPSFAIVINIEPGKLEWMGIALIASAQAFLRDEFRVYVYCRSSRAPQLSPFTRSFLSGTGAVFTQIENDFQPDYPIGNKLIACAHDRPEDYSVFMDTDMLFVRPCFLDDFVRAGAVAIVPAETPSWDGKWEPQRRREQWTTVYDALGLPLPKSRTRLSRHRALSFPYYNAGMIGFESASGFGKTWLDACKALDRHPKILNKRPWPDQVAMPGSIVKAGLRVSERERIWNFALNHRDAEITRDVCVAHYHEEPWLMKKGLNALITRLMRTHEICTSFEQLVTKVESKPIVSRLFARATA